MGALWGFVGMIIGVPLFATVLELTSDFLNRRLEKRGFSLAEEEEETPKKHPHRRRRKAEVPTLEGGMGSLSEEECTHLEALAAADEYRLLTDFSEESLERYVEARRAAARDAEQSDITDITDVPAVPADAEASESPTESAECAAVSD